MKIVARQQYLAQKKQKKTKKKKTSSFKFIENIQIIFNSPVVISNLNSIAYYIQTNHHQYTTRPAVAYNVIIVIVAKFPIIFLFISAIKDMLLSTETL